MERNCPNRRKLCFSEKEAQLSTVLITTKTLRWMLNAITQWTHRSLEQPKNNWNSQLQLYDRTEESKGQTDFIIMESINEYNGRYRVRWPWKE
uniref:Transposase n=1 Tax=Loa loa TaxID=7209 RepID=A0A1I7VKD4_LOALO